MNPLIRFFVRRYVFSIAIFTSIVFFGLTAFTSLGVDLLPEFDIPVVAVNTLYDGAGAQETAEQVSETIEDAIATLPGVTDINSFNGEGFSFVVAQFSSGVNVDTAAIDVKQQIDALGDALPDGASNPIVQKFDPGDQPILQVAVSGSGRSLIDVQRVAEDTIEPSLQQVEGVADVSIVGALDRQIQVLLDPAKLRTFNLTPNQIVGAIGSGSATFPIGNIDVGNERILLSLRDRPESAEDVAGLVVDPSRGLIVSDVARVIDAVDTPSAFTRLDGREVILLQARKISDANAVGTAQDLRAALDGLTLPEGIETQVVGDTTVFVENSVRDTFRETLLAIGAVALVVLLFIGRLGSTFSVVLAIPITLIGALIIFSLLGFTLNTVTLLAITVAVGLVVDDSIVISENIERWRAKGLGPIEAVFKGASEVSVAVLSATLSLLAVFLPIGFLPGAIGQFFSQFGLSLAATIAVSYFEALFFLTVRMAYLPNPLPPKWSQVGGSLAHAGQDVRWTLKRYRTRLWVLLAVLLTVSAGLDGLRGGAAASAAGLDAGITAALLLAGGGLLSALLLPWLLLIVGLPTRTLATALGALLRSMHEATDGLVRLLRGGYTRTLKRLLNPAASTAVLIVAAGLVLTLGWVGPRISFNFVSQVDAGVNSVSISLPPGTPLDRTNQIASEVERIAAEVVPEATNILANVGTGGDFGTSEAEQASVTVELTPQANRDRSSFDIANALQTALDERIGERAPEADINVASSDGGAVPVETGFAITLYANTLDTLLERDELAREILRDNEYLRNPSSSLQGSVNERVFIIDRDAIQGTGLTTADIGSALRTYNVGVRAGNIDAGGEDVGIQVQADPRLLADEQSLLSLPVFASALNTWLPLSEIGRFEVQASPIAIDRANGQYISDLSAEIAQGAPGQFQLRGEIQEAFDEAGVTDDTVRAGAGVGPDFIGELALYGPIAFGLALLLNYMVIASQFNSFRYPFYLLLTVPLALVGAVWLFFITGSALDVISVLGFVILIGLVTKNAILLLDVVVQGLEGDETLKDALVRAGELRLRPILMTALTVITISIPLLLGLGEGSEFRRPLGLVIVGGVVSSTFLTLFVVPAAFYRFERGRYERMTAKAEQASSSEPGSIGAPAGAPGD